MSDINQGGWTGPDVRIILLKKTSMNSLVSWLDIHHPTGCPSPYSSMTSIVVRPKSYWLVR